MNKLKAVLLFSFQRGIPYMVAHNTQLYTSSCTES